MISVTCGRGSCLSCKNDTENMHREQVDREMCMHL